MNRMEERYRRVLRLLPAAYRQAWEEDMVATFMLTAQPKDADEASFAADYGRPSWSEVGSVVALAVRLRLGGTGAPSRYLAWGDAVRRLALVGLLLHAVPALVGMVAGLWSPVPVNDTRDLLGLLWAAAYVSLVAGWWRTAKGLAVLAFAPAVVFFVSDLAAADGAYLLSRLAQLLVDMLLLVAMTAFHREAVPVKPRPWFIALPVSAIIFTGLQLLALFSENGALLDWSSFICVTVIAAAGIWLAAPRARTASWSTALAILAIIAFGLRVLTLLDDLQFVAPGADRSAMIAVAVTETVAVLAIAVVLTLTAERKMRRLSW
jgi:hypothetical protein